MVKQEWGLKRTCQSCGIRFYDISKTPIICPKCKHTFDPDIFMKSRRSSRAAAQVVLKDVVDPRLFDPLVEEEDDIVFPVEAGALEDDVLIEDASDLGGEDDVVEVIHREDKDNT